MNSKITMENLYSKKDKENGFIMAKDRFNVERSFNLLSVSSAIIEINSKSNINNFDSTLNMLKKHQKVQKTYFKYFVTTVTMCNYFLFSISIIFNIKVNYWAFWIQEKTKRIKWKTN